VVDLPGEICGDFVMKMISRLREFFPGPVLENLGKLEEEALKLRSEIPAPGDD
jgi:hypothetical protein